MQFRLSFNIFSVTFNVCAKDVRLSVCSALRTYIFHTELLPPKVQGTVDMLFVSLVNPH